VLLGVYSTNIYALTKRQYHKIRTAKYRISNIAKSVKSVTQYLAASAAFESF